MTRLPQAGVDMRSFSWPLLPLERKLHWERDAARAVLAQCLLALQDGQLRAGALEQEHIAQAACAQACLRQALDPQAHRQALRYLACMDGQLLAARHRLRGLQEASDRARAECLARECKLETLLAARAAALRTHMRRAAQRQHKEADVAWLMHDAYVRAGDRGAP